MIGKTLAHYEIVEKIGEGGMGEVYRARDTKLERDVALKVLPPEVATDSLRLQRFEREAKTVASLNHPHVVHMYSVEEDAGVHFLTMELVEGRTLDEMIPAGGLPLARVLEIGIAVADAIAAAHDSGIVHRDIKPANVMVTTDGRVKVLDFGLAKLARSTAPPLASSTQAPSLTGEGVVVGTMPYMSPEQLQGSDVDGRTDIFSLGVMLYEMAVGHRPFDAARSVDLAASILRDEPTPITEIKSDLPRRLERVVAGCLEKEPRNRSPSAHGVRDGLLRVRSTTSATADRARNGWRWGLVTAVVALAIAWTVLSVRDLMRSVDDAAPTSTVRAGEDQRSIAVLPFADMSPNRDHEYFADGISEGLLNLLARIPELKVAARTSSFSFKGKDVEIPEIARQLAVGHVLEGSVRKSGERVRVTAELIHAADGFQVWSRTWDRELDDIFAIQDEIAADVVKELRITLLGDVPKTRRTVPEAYALYLRSVHLARRNTREDFEKSGALLQRVLEIDSTYAPGWAGLAANRANEALSGFIPLQEGLVEAREANLRALEIDPQLAPAYAGLAFVAMYGESDFAAAAGYLEQGFALDPADARVLANSATLLNLLGRREEALELREAIAIRDAVNVNALFNLGTSQLNAGRFDEAIESFRTVLSLSPGNGVAHYQLGVASLLGGDPDGALSEFEQESVEVFRMIGLPLAYHALGRKADSEAALARLIAAYEEDAAYNIAGVQAFREEADSAFEWLEREQELGGTFAEIAVDPLFVRLRDDPRWIPFLRTIGKAPEQLAAIGFEVTLPE